MDYTNDPDGKLYGQLSNLHPNKHDYDELVAIYSHLDNKTTVFSSAASGAGAGGAAQGSDDDFGPSTGKRDGKGRDILFLKNLGGGAKLITAVIWTDEKAPTAR